MSRWGGDGLVRCMFLVTSHFWPSLLSTRNLKRTASWVPLKKGGSPLKFGDSELGNPPFSGVNELLVSESVIEGVNWKNHTF